MLARGFEQVQGADGVDAEIRVRLARGPVVRRLRGGVNDQGDVLAECFEKIFHRLPVADVEIVVLITRNGGDEFLPVGQSGRFPAEKPLAQVVVNADDLEPFAGKPPDALRAN